MVPSVSVDGTATSFPSSCEVLPHVGPLEVDVSRGGGYATQDRVGHELAPFLGRHLLGSSCDAMTVVLRPLRDFMTSKRSMAFCVVVAAPRIGCTTTDAVMG